MWGVRGGVAAAAVAVALSVGMGPAVAEEAQASPPPPSRFLLIAGTDAWRNGGFAYTGAMWAANGLDNEGFVFKAALGGGLYRYHSDALGGIEVTGYKTDASLLPGWHFRRGDLFVTVLAGLDWQRHKLLPDDPTAGLRGNYFGARGTIELWYQPTSKTMLAGDASTSTIGPSYSGRLAYGWKLLDSFYTGPEISAFTSNGNYQQYRAGIHITGLRFSSFSRQYAQWLNFEWSAGLGFAHDSDRRESVYVKLGILMRQ